MCNAKTKFMGFQLWYSKETGIRRKGTTFEEIQNIFIDNITTRFIYEPLACCKLNDNPFEVKRTLEERDFDLLGVIDNKENKIGYVEKIKLNVGTSIEECFSNFDYNEIIAESTPLSELFTILENRDLAFILKGNEIAGIVTRADLNKPVVRIYLFGLISLFEMNINFWIKHFFKEETWKDILKKERINAAEKLLEIRRGENLDLELLECLQFCDKRDILRKSNDFIEKFQFASKPKFEKLLRRVEAIRNELAHSQNSIIANIEWKEFVQCIMQMQRFLVISENEIEK